jgi:SAM-dependent methyltransferase
MCNPACIDFARKHLDSWEVRDRAVLEVGSLDVNGSLRAYVESLGPTRYVGIDIVPGTGVDEVCDARDALERYGPQSFDVLISTELIEHVRDWREVVHGFKQMLRPEGVLIVTTRSRGHPYHGYPADFWRYEIEDLRQIFGDLQIETLENDPIEVGVFLKARKPHIFEENKLDAVALYSMITKTRTQAVSRWRLLLFRLKMGSRRRFAHFRYRIWDTIMRLTPRPLKNLVKRKLLPLYALFKNPPHPK